MTLKNDGKIKRKIILAVIAAVICAGIFFSGNEETLKFSISEYKSETETFSSKNIFGNTRYADKITDNKTAKKEAEKIWTELYGDSVQKEKPYKVYRDEENNALLVKGTIKKHKMGGTAHIIFSVDDGEVIAVWHTR